MRNDKLRSVVSELGYTNVETVISSGNVLFDADSDDDLEARLEAAWPASLGFHSTTIIRSAEEIDELVARNPFGDLDDLPKARLQVTFLKNAQEPSFDIPHSPPDSDYSIVATPDRAVCSVVDPTGRTPDLMTWLERQFGKEITTRTWKTVHRLARRLA